jgi:sugar lactone lactonase YvrE
MAGNRTFFGRLISGVSLSLAISACPAMADIALLGARAHPENVAADSKGNLYVSNMAEGGVVRVRNGRAEAWIKPGAFGSGATFGMLPQPKTGMLWVCSNDLSMIKLAKSADGKNALIGFDLSDGTGKISIGFPDDRADCNDVALGRDGSIYVTDGRSSRIFRLSPGKRAFELFFSDPRLQDNGYGVDGIAVGDDGDLYINTNPSGKFFRLEVLNGKAGPLTEFMLDKPLGTADGMRHERGNQFIVVSTSGLERLKVNGKAVSVENLRNDLNQPSGVAILGARAYVAEGQVARLLGGQPPSLPFMLRTVPLSTK